MKYIKVYIKAGSTFLQKAKNTGKICRLNLKIYYLKYIHYTSEKNANASFFTS